ncbi:MAG: response regulator transcription factor [Armatimonadetes bacterium]|nr:response regulator transcription factor [Armatimonadota bacterium]
MTADTATEERTARLLVVEDDSVMAEMLQYNLAREGYKVDLARDAESALRKFHADPADVVVLDVMLPGRSGLDVCRVIRETSNAPIIFVSAKTADLDRVAGLELGADDYVTKPFNMKELMLRVRGLLRRGQPQERQERLAFGDVEIDLTGKVVYKNGEPLQMTPKEFALLALLASHPGKAFTRDQLLDRVWGLNSYITPRTVDVHIRWLRAKVEPNPAQPTWLQTVRGSGYRFSPGA